ncbi:peptidoglycan DD-metalloendopeptidase family protein [Jatrophihabitans sp.]|uniref:peptidoglycan DD-metalloendopeptidase family protein n=1 Tax=Jatrophihabitans sp. TaxID=1932789 RepID=UPI002CACBBC6|nr:peptidoglycan DD-metalloendopeptidase family protein [Jatrophihabitans sp.]
MGLRTACRTGSGAALASVTVLGLLLGLSTPVQAAPKPVNPTDKQLAAAQATKQRAAQQLGAVTAQLVLLKGQLDRAAADTDAAIAAYDATNIALSEAVDDVTAANQAVDTARTTVAKARHQIADYVFSSYVYGRQPSITTLLSGTDPNSALEAMAYQRYLGAAQQQHLATAQTNTVALSNAEAGRKRALQRAERLQRQAEDQKNRAMAKLAAFRQQQTDFNRRRAELTAQTAAAAKRLAALTNQRRAFERWQAEERARQARERARQAAERRRQAAERRRQAAEWARQEALRRQQQQQQHSAPSPAPLPSAAPPSDDQPWTLPLPAGSFYMSTCFCMRWGEFHTGDDLAAGYGTPIYAIGSGTVVAAGPASGFGNWVVIDHGNGFTSIYGHMKVLAVSAGQYVSVGQKIAYVGSEGQSTGPHLHLEVRVGGMFGPRVDPQVFLARRGVYI